MKFRVIPRVSCALAAALAASCLGPQSRANDYSFNVPNGDYNAAASWNPNGVPTGFNNVIIDNGGTATLAEGLGDAAAFTIGSTASGSGTIVISGGDFQAGDSIRIGESGTGTANVTSGAFRAGPPSTGSSIFIGGQNGTGTGTLNFSGEGSIVRAADDFILGRTGTGTLNFEGGWITGGYTVVGKFGTGTWNQSGGVFEQAFGDIEIGDGGTPDQTGTSGPRLGTINLTGGVMQSAGHLAIGNRVGGGEVNVSGGVLAVTGSVADGAIIIGRGMNWEGQPGAGGATALRVIGDDSRIIANGSLEMNKSNVASSSTLIAQITGSTHTTIKVAGNAEIGNGDFKVELDGYTPTLGDSWTIIEAGADLVADKDATTLLANSLVNNSEFFEDSGLNHAEPISLGTVIGQFAATDYSMASLPGELAWDLSYTTNSVVLSVVESDLLPGDYDLNGTVDAADYEVWKTNFGSTTSLNADGNGNQVVDAADYTIWRDNFAGTVAEGSALRGAGAVPEPASILVLFSATAAGAFVRSRRAFRPTSS